MRAVLRRETHVKWVTAVIQFSRIFLFFFPFYAKKIAKYSRFSDTIFLQGRLFDFLQKK
jgi:hypothetical protein